jgi:ectoine hydroxylase-related dioxygenase (phytanoyl-CoA dioxygenase family)
MIDMQQFAREGFVMTPSLLSSEEISNLIGLIEAQTAPKETRGGIRDIMNRIPELRAVADSPSVKQIVDSVLGCGAFVVRTTLFDKTDGANWKVPWHQDVTIAVRERRETEGYGPWSQKEGIVHVQPPTEVLEQMVTVRVHLDPCPATNGALRVMPGTHHLGRIHQNNAPEHVDEKTAVCCEANPGEALVMRPLLLHASSAATQPAHRRILHFDFAVKELKGGLQWGMR